MATKKPKKGEKIKLHQWIARGGNPKEFKGATANAVANKKK